MGLFSSLKNINKKLLGKSIGSKVSNLGKGLTKGLTYGFSKEDKYSLLGQYGANQDAVKAAEEAAKLQEQQQADLLTAQENAAKNSLADLTLKNTPNVVAGGTADFLFGNRRRRASGATSSIMTQLGLS